MLDLLTYFRQNAVQSRLLFEAQLEEWELKINFCGQEIKPISTASERQELSNELPHVICIECGPFAFYSIVTYDL